jgi:hypothetical protein
MKLASMLLKPFYAVVLVLFLGLMLAWKWVVGESGPD